MLNLSEQFKSIQGESTYAGELCSFIRLAGCNLKCSYCDTKYAAENGAPASIAAILAVVEKHHCRLVEVTGGEPLVQEETPELCRCLIDKRYNVLVETNGSRDISQLPDGCVRVMDVKCPSSGMADTLYVKNLDLLHARDQVKFVMADAADFAWAHEFVVSRQLHERCTVIFSPVAGMLHPRDLAELIINASAPVRLGLQLHKYIWGIDAQGH